MLKRLLRKILPNPFNQLLNKMKKSGEYRFLIYWNRGMGDVSLFLYGLLEKIRHAIPHAEVTFITRTDLEPAFRFLKDIKVIVDPYMARGEHYILDKGVDPTQYDVVLDKPDPAYWLQEQFGHITPKLKWDPSFDHIPYEKRKCVGMHVNNETVRFYGVDRNWPKELWKVLAKRLSDEGYEVLLFGNQSQGEFADCNVTDLRGKTTLLEVMSLIKNRCTHLIAPDSGILSLTYFIDAPFDLKVISLWANPKLGIMKAAVDSPNPKLQHIPLVSEDLSQLSVDSVVEVM